jgi:branched-chain amino acid transport system ATP-binding protein
MSDADIAVSLEDVVAGYGILTILNGLTLAVRGGCITTLIGANGAGKSTVFKTLFGLVPARAGRIRLHGEDITNKTPRELLARGMVYVPQGRNLFPQLTVRHNLELGGITLPKAELPRRMEAVLDRFPRIRQRADAQASTLSGGEQKQLEIGRALLHEPKVLLIDEPSIGLAPKVVAEVFELLVGLAASGVAVLMVEQNVRSALKISHRAVALEAGRVAVEGTGEGLLADPRIAALYLGGHVAGRDGAG